MSGEKSLPPQPPSLKSSIIEPVGAHAGMGPYDCNLARGLSACGIDVTLFTSDTTPAPSDLNFNFRPIYHGVFGANSTWRRALHYFWGTIYALFASVRQGRRICHFHFFNVGPAELMNIILARLCLRKIVITAHDVKAFASGHPHLSRIAYALAHSVIAHNVVSKNELIDDLGVPPDKICIIPHGNYPDCLSDETSRREARESLRLPENAHILLFFGQIKDVKGLSILLEAMPRILARHPDTLLVIAGRPFRSTFDSYYTQINNLAIQANCICKIQYISDAERSNYYKACDLVILPYRRIYQSGVLLMAMSYGRAVLTSDIPGMLEIIEPQNNGFLFCDGDADNLAQVAIKALSNPVLREEVALNGLRLMRNHYDWNSIGQSTAELYKSLYF